MPIWADPARGEQVRLLADDDLSLLATFVAPPSTRPTAADLRAVPGTDLGRLATVATRDLGGVRVVTRGGEAAALIEAGATVVGTEIAMVRGRLQEDPPPLRWAAPHLTADLNAVGVEAVSLGDIAAAQRLAFGPDHPDHRSTLEAQEAGQLEALLAGELLGPLYPDASTAVVDAEGHLVACLLATQWEGIGEEWPGGPWLANVFTVPGTPLLLGRALLARAVAVAALDGHEAVGLTVSATDPARRLFQRLGFGDAFSRVTLDLPGAWPAEP